MDFDDILRKVGEFHRYQKLMYIVICLPAAWPAAWSSFNYIFVTASPDYWCRQFNDSLEFQSSHSSRAKCFQPNSISGTQNASESVCRNGWEYDDTTYKSTIVTEVP